VTRFRFLLIALCLAIAAAGLVACGGGGSKEDPQKVLDETFSGAKAYDSGVLDATLTTSGGAQNLDATVNGPFVSNAGGLPKFQLKIDIKSPVSFSGGLTSTGDGAFLDVQGTNYQVDDTNFTNFKQLFLGLQQQVSNPGVKIGDYVSNLSNEGNENVGGVDTVHISGSLDVNKLAQAARTAAAASGNKVAGLQQFLDSASRTEEASFDVFSGADDKRVHKIDVHFKFAASGSNQGGDVDFSATFNDLGQPQTITQPTNVKPLSALLQQLQGLLGSSGGAGASSTGTTPAPTGTTGTPTPPSNGQSSAYLDCLSKARGQDAIQACSSQIQ
jgi:hypothetical protein